MRVAWSPPLAALPVHPRRSPWYPPPSPSWKQEPIKKMWFIKERELIGYLNKRQEIISSKSKTYYDSLGYESNFCHFLMYCTVQYFAVFYCTALYDAIPGLGPRIELLALHAFSFFNIMIFNLYIYVCMYIICT